MPIRFLILALAVSMILCEIARADPDFLPTEDAHKLTACRHVRQAGISGVYRDSIVDARLAGATALLQAEDNQGDVECCVVLERAGSVTLFPPSLDGAQYNNITTDADAVTVLDSNCGNVKLVTSMFGVCGRAGPVYGCAYVPGSSMIVTSATRGTLSDIVWAHEFGHNQGLRHVTDDPGGINVMNRGLTLSNTAIRRPQCSNFHGLHAVSARPGHSPPDEIIGTCSATANLLAVNPTYLIEIEPMTGAGRTLSASVPPNTASLTRGGRFLYTTAQGKLHGFDLAIGGFDGQIGSLHLAEFSLTTPTALAYDPKDSRLYGRAGSTVIPGDSYLITIDPNTAEVSDSVAITLGSDNVRSIDSMEFNPVTRELWAFATTINRLVKVDPHDGTATAAPSPCKWSEAQGRRPGTLATGRPVNGQGVQRSGGRDDVAGLCTPAVRVAPIGPAPKPKLTPELP